MKAVKTTCIIIVYKINSPVLLHTHATPRVRNFRQCI